MTNFYDIQIYSDLHIELHKSYPKIPPKCKTLFLAGDICKIDCSHFLPFFTYCSQNWEKVFYVPGNHEYYVKGKTMQEIDKEFCLFFENTISHQFPFNMPATPFGGRAEMNELEQLLCASKMRKGVQEVNQKPMFSNIYLLNNSFASFTDDIEVYGTTLWTPSNSVYPRVSSSIADYQEITVMNPEPTVLDIKYTNQLAEDSLNKLVDYLEKVKKRVIVMTHFPPFSTGSSNPVYLTQPKYIKNYFAWEDDMVVPKLKTNIFKVGVWISGHTHWSYRIRPMEIDFIANQVGYAKENTGKFIEDGVFQVQI